MKNIDDMELPELYRRKKFLICGKIPHLLNEQTDLIKDMKETNEEQLGSITELISSETGGLEENEAGIYCNKYFSYNESGEHKQVVNEDTINFTYEQQPEPLQEEQNAIMEMITEIENMQSTKRKIFRKFQQIKKRQSNMINILSKIQNAILKKLDENQIQSYPADQEDEDEGEEEDEDQEDQDEMQSDEEIIYENIMNDLEC
jgi:hypothetical protein